MEPDDSLERRLAALPRADLDSWRSQRLRLRAHRELMGARAIEQCGLRWFEPVLLASCAATVLARLLWFVLALVSGTV